MEAKNSERRAKRAGEKQRAKSKELRVHGKDSMLCTLCSLLIALSLAGCGYTLHERTALPFNEIQIEGIENRTLEPKLQDMFYRAITEEFLKYGIGVQSRADYKLSGTINRY